MAGNKNKSERTERKNPFSPMISKIKSFFYGISVKLHALTHKNKKTNKIKKGGRNRGAMIFCILMLAYPIVQWLIFYAYANINSVLLAFQRYNVDTGAFEFLSVNNMFRNFANVLGDLFGSGSANLGRYFLNGALFHLVGLLVAYPISLLFAFIVYKKVPLSGFFRVMLYLPSILSGMVISMLFKYFVERAIPAWGAMMGTENFPELFDPDHALGTLLFYALYFGMPGSIVINVSTMSRVPNDLIEYGKLEGLTMFQEFRYLTVPLIYPLLEVQLLGAFVGFFTYSGPLYALFAEDAFDRVGDSVITFGYYMTTRIVGRNASEAYYGYTAASNLMIGLVSVPIVYGTKWLLDKLDPGVEF